MCGSILSTGTSRITVTVLHINSLQQESGSMVSSDSTCAWVSRFLLFASRRRCYALLLSIPLGIAAAFTISISDLFPFVL